MSAAKRADHAWVLFLTANFMSPDEVENLTSEQMQEAVAKARGWKYRDGYIYGRLWARPGSDEFHEATSPPNYLRDLNEWFEIEAEMHDAKNGSYWNSYATALRLCVCAKAGTDPIHANGSQRAAAYLMTLHYAPKQNSEHVSREAC